MRRLILAFMVLSLAACEIEPVPPAGGPVGADAPTTTITMPPPSRRPTGTPLAEAPPPPNLADERAAAALNGASRGEAVRERPAAAIRAVDLAPPPPRIVPKVESPRDGLALDLRVPDHMAAVGGPVVLPVEAELSNQGSAAVALIAPTPCAVASWRLRDGAGRLIADKPKAICVQMVAESELRPGEVLITRERIELPPGALATPGAYRLDYAFWGVEAEASIAVE